MGKAMRRPAHLVLAGLLAALVGAIGQAQSRDSSGWQIPQNAAAEVSPLPQSADVVAKGQKIYKSKCERCHGTTGKGNGPDAERDDPPGDLTDPKRASRNPDGVMFYKIWNGRSDPKMPAFKTDISQYVKTLRQTGA
jgi:mono/diheme cytochrome c family protein